MKPTRIVKITVEIFDDSDGVAELRTAIRSYQEGLLEGDNLYIRGPAVWGANNMYTIDAKKFKKQ